MSFEREGPELEDADLARLFQLDDGDGPALPLSSERAAAVVDRAVRQTQRRRAKVVRLRRPWFVGVGVVVAATGAAAAYELGERLWGRSEPAASTASPPSETSSPHPSHERAPRSAAEAETPQETTPETAPGEPTLADTPPEPTKAPEVTKTSPGRAALDDDRPPQPVSEPAAIDKLQRANEARKSRRYDDALRLYLEVVDQYPHSLQAQAARVAAASLTLEHRKDPDAARKLYEQAHRRGGQLSEEASYGLAETHRRNGDRVKERQSLEHFLRHYPDSPLARVARSRLDELNEAPANK